MNLQTQKKQKRLGVKSLVIVALVTIGILLGIGYYAWSAWFAPPDISVQITSAVYNASQKTLNVSASVTPIRWVGIFNRAYVYLVAITDGNQRISLQNPVRDDVDSPSNSINFQVQNITLVSSSVKLTMLYTVVYVDPNTAEETDSTGGTILATVTLTSQ